MIICAIFHGQYHCRFHRANRFRGVEDSCAGIRCNPTPKELSRNLPPPRGLAHFSEKQLTTNPKLMRFLINNSRPDGMIAALPHKLVWRRELVEQSVCRNDFASVWMTLGVRIRTHRSDAMRPEMLMAADAKVCKRMQRIRHIDGLEAKVEAHAVTNETSVVVKERLAVDEGRQV